MNKLVLSIAIVLMMVCSHLYLVQAQTCFCARVSSPTCSVVTERSVDVDGTVRCDSVLVSDCQSTVCDVEGNLFCESLATVRLEFNGTADICDSQVVSQLVVTTFGTELGTEDFASGGFAQTTSLSNQGLNTGAAGTVYYLQFTTGSDITSLQIIYEDGGTGSGVAVTLSGEKFQIYGGRDNLVREILPIGASNVLQNTFYSMLLWFQRSSADGTPDGAYKMYLVENLDILDLTREDVSPAAESAAFEFSRFGGGGNGGVGTNTANVQGFPSGYTGSDFLGTFAATSVLKVW
eukprot:CAMPEP_0182441476 /NCGR_PEP_ID=MMETSP1172-20130603/445_1 /TAXON_ID=708627 /ORGANISM="Timspurckia oligopyrenoides, Strain CCMP3278" /LENGTH=291 /DNA_ID=CAMNT_0024635781 /DNA_START=207 /DNA_END=1079 /DNA_ORIENTATION=-